jgi:DnaJ family protein C protein 2
LALDERPKKFRQEGNKEKNKKKADKEAAEQAAKDAKIKAKEDAEKAAKEKEIADKAAREDGKKAKEAAKNAAKKNKRTIRGAVKDANYFVDGEAPAAQIEGALNDVDSIILKLEVEDIAVLASALNGKDKTAIKQVFQDERKRLIDAGKAKDGELKTLA